MLKSEVQAVEKALGESLQAGRERLSWLVSRDVAVLTEVQVRESAIESLAENLNDSVVAPIFWFLLLGLPGAALYRFANTADAIWGYRGERNGQIWEWGGKWTAWADDCLSWLPARLTATLLAVVSGGFSVRTPSSLLGQSHQKPGGLGFDSAPSLVPQLQVLDRAYEPLRLSGHCAWTAERLSQVWQLWSPNKALGLTEVRAAYVIAPTGAGDIVTQLNRLSPSWPLGAHGVALLQAWMKTDTQAWLAESLDTLRVWKARQVNCVKALGWEYLLSESNFFCAQIAEHISSLKFHALLTQLRRHGIKLRDASSFGLPGHVRLAVQPVAAQNALIEAVRDIEHFNGPHQSVTAPLTQDFV